MIYRQIKHKRVHLCSKMLRFFIIRIIYMKYIITIFGALLYSVTSLAQSNQELAYTQQVYETYMWKAKEFYKDCCYEECIESLEFCSRMNRNHFILHPKTFERMRFVPKQGNETQIQQFIQECKKKRIGSITCSKKERMYLYATYWSSSLLDNVSFITPCSVNVKIPSQYIKDAVNSARIAKQIYQSRKLSMGNMNAHRNYREKMSENKAYYRGTNWNRWDGLQTMSYYFWIDLGGNPTIEVKMTTGTYDTLVFYLDVDEIDTYINVLSKVMPN